MWLCALSTVRTLRPFSHRFSRDQVVTSRLTRVCVRVGCSATDLTTQYYKKPHVTVQYWLRSTQGSTRAEVSLSRLGHRLGYRRPRKAKELAGEPAPRRGAGRREESRQA